MLLNIIVEYYHTGKNPQKNQLQVKELHRDAFAFVNGGTVTACVCVSV